MRSLLVSVLSCLVVSSVRGGDACSFEWVQTHCPPNGPCESPFDPIYAISMWDGRPHVGGLLLGQDGSEGVARRGESGWESLAGGFRCWDNKPCGYPADAAARDFITFRGELVAGGEFIYAGDQEVNTIASWNGSRWAPVGTGFFGCESAFECTARVSVLKEFRGELVAAGNFTQAGMLPTGPLAVWNGVNWRALGPPIRWSEFSYGTVQALAIYDGKLVAGGSFLSIGDVPINNIASWNGTSWEPLGLGIDDMYGTVEALAIYDGKLIAGGGFTSVGGEPAFNVAVWDGSEWSPLGTEPTFPVYALATFNGELFAGGYCPSPDYPEPWSNCLARWNGTSWETLGGGVAGAQYPAPHVFALEVVQRDLYVGGGFEFAGGKPAAGWARWAPTGTHGDWDGDGFVNSHDAQAWPNCLSGPAEAGSIATTSAECLCVFNSDGDGDFDLADLAAVQNVVGN